MDEKYAGIIYLGKKISFGKNRTDEYLLILIAETDAALKLTNQLTEKKYLNSDSWESRAIPGNGERAIPGKWEYVTVAGVYKKMAQLESIAALAHNFNMLVVRRGSKLEAEILEDRISQDRYLQLEPWMYTVAKILFG